MIEEWEMAPLQARYNMLLFGDGRILFDKFKGRIAQGTKESLATFLKKANTNPTKIPKSSGPMQARCIK